MIKDIKDKIDLLLEHNKCSIPDTDYCCLKAYIDLIYCFALPTANEQSVLADI